MWHDVDLNLFSPERVSLTGLHSAGGRTTRPKQSIETVPRDPTTTPTPISNNLRTRSTKKVFGETDLVTLAPVDLRFHGCSLMHTTIIGSTTQVNVKHSQGHLFLLLDIIMGIPTQA